MTPFGKGPYLLLVDYGSEGYGITRYETEQALLEAISRGAAGPFLVARELNLFLLEAGEQGGKP